MYGGEIPKEEIYNEYGDPAREIEIGAMGKHGTPERIPYADIPEGESLIGGRFFYAVGNKPLSAGCKKTGAYFGEKYEIRRVILREMFPVVCGNECIGANCTITDHYGIIVRNCVRQVEFYSNACIARIFDVGALKARYLCVTSRRGRKGKCGLGDTETTVRAEYRVWRLVKNHT